MSTPPTAPTQTHPTSLAAHTSTLPPPPQLLLFGDSITQGALPLQATLTGQYMRRLDILNRGLGGYNTTSALHTLPSFFPAIAPSQTHARVAAMIVHFGANDSCSAGEPQHCSEAQFKENLGRIVRWEGVRLHGTQVVLVTPGPVEEYRLPHDGEGRAERVARYAAVVREVGREEGLPVVDLWTAMMRTTAAAAGGWKEGAAGPLPGSAGVQPSVELGRLFYDGLHLTHEGYDIYTRELVGLLEREVPECQVDKTPEWYPEWVHFHPPRS